MLLLSTDGKKYAGLILSIQENSFLENGELRRIIRFLSPIASNSVSGTYFLLNRQEFVKGEQEEKTEPKHSLLLTLKAPWKVNLVQYETEFKNTVGKVNHQADHYINRYDASSRRNDVWVTFKMKSVFCRLECKEIAEKTSYEDCTTRPGTGKPTMSSCH